LRGYLKDHREALIAYASEKKSISREEAGRQLDGFVAGLELFDRVELTQRSEAGHLTLTLHVQGAQPFRK
jgi:hypothetical protein